jgi:hypothetical protein
MLGLKWTDPLCGGWPNRARRVYPGEVEWLRDAVLEHLPRKMIADAASNQANMLHEFPWLSNQFAPCSNLTKQTRSALTPRLIKLHGELTTDSVTPALGYAKLCKK